jgi:hypothetical protein
MADAPRHDPSPLAGRLVHAGVAFGGRPPTHWMVCIPDGNRDRILPGHRAAHGRLRINVTMAPTTADPAQVDLRSVPASREADATCSTCVFAIG